MQGADKAPKIERKTAGIRELRPLVESLLQRNAFGLCAFEPSGKIVLREGLPEKIGLELSSHIEEWPGFTGLLDQILRLRRSASTLELPAIGHSGQKFDIAILWLGEHGVFAAQFFPAKTRAKFDSLASQAARENRILLEKIRLQQEEISAQNELMRSFIDRVPAAVAMLDDRLNYVMVSKRWLVEMAPDKVHLKGSRFALGLPAHAPRWEAALKRDDDAAKGGIEKIETANGAPQWHRWERERLANTKAAGVRTLLFAENITANMQQTQKLRAQGKKLATLNEEMRAFALAASHDLRAPMRQIGSFAKFLSEDHRAELGAQAQGFVDRIQDCAARSGQMLEALLRYAKITNVDAAASVISLASVVKAASANLRREIAIAGARIKVAPGVKLRGDAMLLSILFQNLIDNALKYAGATPLILDIAAQTGRDGLIDISFTDNGCGIAPAKQSKAFDLFQRLGANVIVGSGVGLATCRKIVELQGGQMHIDAAYDKGLRFCISLPGATPKPEA